ncbi:DUF998 domain-containing protein [Streptomyces subrutilus]|uniref:DUF998 domain-containing protein n=1 Tax=Streptomyces subrutilus TaxID=36818 RepID=UPI0033DDC975
MPRTLNAPIAPRAGSAPSEPAPAPRATRLLLVGGVVAGPLFLLAGLAQGFARDGFAFSRNAISQLALGGAGWIQTVNFLLTAALLAVGAIGLRRVLRRGSGGRWGPALVGVLAVSFVAAALFPADAGAGFPAGAPDAASLSAHGAAHMISGMAGYLALCAAFLVLARPLAARGHGGWAVASCLVPLGVLAGFVGSSATVLAFTLGAGLGLVWLAAVTARLVN